MDFNNEVSSRQHGRKERITLMSCSRTDGKERKRLNQHAGCTVIAAAPAGMTCPTVRQSVWQLLTMAILSELRVRKKFENRRHDTIISTI